MGFTDDLDDLRARCADEPDLLALVDLVAQLHARVAELEAAKGLLLETATANLEFMQATNARLDALEADSR